jgi:putative spermidine/putrescine transport system ATP-binding protein
MSLEIQNIRFLYNQENLIFNDISISLKKGNIYAIMGLSGSGKSTLLNIISGLQKIHQGKIVLNGKDITTEKPHLRKVGYVFQDYGLFPNLTVRENIEFGLKSKFTKEQIKEKLNEILEITQLEAQVHSNVNQLSGGQKQRVALARTLVTLPDILLLDEVFSAIDNDIKSDIRKSLKEILKKTNCTTLMVSHSFDDVCHLSDEAFFIVDKKIVGPYKPMDLLTNPINNSIAKLIGLNNVIENKIQIKNISTELLYIPENAFTNDANNSTIEIMPTNDFVIKNGVKWFEYEFFGKHIYSISENKFIDTKKIIGLND